MEKCGIYKITNLINNKIYVGQSRHIYRRWIEHRYSAKDQNNPTLLYRAMRKYGENNFCFEIIEECEPNQLNEREAYYMYLYNSFTPNGYNIKIPSEDNIYIHVPDYVNEIIYDLLYSDLKIVDIAKKYELSEEQISRINKGSGWKLQDYIYPLRSTYNNWDCSQVIPLLQKGYKTKEIAFELNTTKSTIESYMYMNNIHTSDYRKRLTSNKLTILQKENETFSFNSIKEAGQFLAQKENIEFNTALCGIKRALKREAPKNTYKGYICVTYDSFIDDRND